MTVAVPEGRELNEKEKALVLCFTAAGISASGFAFPLASTLMSIGFAAFLIFWANPIGLPALAVLWVQAVSFGGGAYQAQSEFDNAVIIAGFPVTLQLFTLVWMTMRAMVEWIAHRKTFAHRAWVRRSILLWSVFAVITLLSAIWGRSSGFSNWTQPLRASMSLACLFYGMVVAAKVERAPWVAEWYLWIAIGVLALVESGTYWNHVVFFYITLGACAFWYAVRSRRWLLAVGCALAPFVALFSEDALTFIAAAVVSLFAGYSWFYSRKRRTKKVSRWKRMAIPTVVLIVSVVLVGAVVFTSYSPDLQIIPTSSLAQRFLFKLYLDRGVLWRAAWSAMAANPELLSPAGRPLLINSPFFSLPDNLWTVHVHNSFLEMARETGIPGGIIFIAIVIRFWRKLRNALFDATVPWVRVFAGATLIAILLGSTTGIWPFDFFAGPWIWLWSGVAIGLTRAPSERSAVPSPPVAAA